MLLLFISDVWRLFLWKVKKDITATNAFQKFFDEYYHKLKKILGDKSSEFNNRSIKSWLQDNDIEIAAGILIRIPNK